MKFKPKVFCTAIIILSFLLAAESGKAKKQSAETSTFNFLRLFLYRLIYGLASMIGAEEGISDFMGGILVPPNLNDDYTDDEDDFEY